MILLKLNIIYVQVPVFELQLPYPEQLFGQYFKEQSEL